MSVSNNFNPDRPIESSRQDKLERADFAHQLAERISAWKGLESLVIGLYGDWGSGKSSVKNLITERLRKEKDSAPVIVEFNPWLVSGEEKITQAFFDEVGCKLEGLQKDPSANARATSWKKYAHVLEVASRATTAFDLISPAFGIVSPGAGAWAAKRLKKAQELAEGAAASLESKSQSLHEAKQELREHFCGLTKPLLVVIDDIDRLTTEEICLVFRLVKANADFPNIIYLLLFQRETAERALDKISNDKGKEYLQKIVQVGFDLPAPSVNSLHQILFKEIDRILEPIMREADWENERWVNVWMTDLSHYFTNVREIYRFLNSFSFMVSAFGRKGTLEVNPVDMIAIECLRVFEPGVYAVLRENKSLLAERHGTSARERLTASAEELLKAALGDKSKLKQMLQLIFPELQSIWGNMGYDTAFYPIWTRQRRICSPEFFDRFFILRLPSGQVSESVIQAIVAAREDRVELQKIFGELERDELLLATIERLESEESLDKLKNPLPYLLALADISDRLPASRKISLLIRSGSILVRWAVMRVLKTRKNDEEKSSIIRSLICDSESISLAVEWIDDVTEPKEDSCYPKIEGPELNELKDCWLKRVRAAAKERHLLNVANLNWVVPYWMKWAEPSEVKEWVSSLFAHPKEILKFLKAYTNEAQSQSVGSYYAHDKGWLSWKSCLGEFQPREKWEQIADELSKMANLAVDESRTLRLLQAALKRWQSGVEDDSFRTFEDREARED